MPPAPCAAAAPAAPERTGTAANFRTIHIQQQQQQQSFHPQLLLRRRHSRPTERTPRPPWPWPSLPQALWLFVATALLVCCCCLPLSVSGSSNANLLFGALTTPLVPLNSLPPLSPAIPLSTTYDCTLEGAGRTGNALRMQDAHAYLSTSAPLFTNHPAGVPAITFSMWFQQQVPSNVVPFALAPQIAMYELGPDLLGDKAPWSLYAYSRLSADLGGMIVESQIADLLDGKWHHVLFSWRSDTGDTNWYFDGVKAMSSVAKKGYLLPAGGTFSLAQMRFGGPGMMNFDEVGLFASVLSRNDRNILRGVGGTQASSSSSGPTMMGPSMNGATMIPPEVPSIFTTSEALRRKTNFFLRTHAELFYSFDQSVRCDSRASDLLEERIHDDSGRGNEARILCATHCASSALMPSRVADPLRGRGGMHLSNRTTLLFPLRPWQQDFLLLLANGPSSAVGVAAASNPGAADVALAEQVTITRLPDPSMATLLRVNPSISSAGGLVNGSAEVPLSVGDIVRLEDMDPELRQKGVVAVVLRVGPAMRDFTEFAYELVPSSPSPTTTTTTTTLPPVPSPPPPPPAVGSVVALGPNHPPSPAPPAGYSSSSASTSLTSASVQSSYTRVIEVDESSLTSFLPLYRMYPAAKFFAADVDGDPVEAWVVRVPGDGEGRLFHSMEDAKLGRNPILNASLDNPVRLTRPGGMMTFEAPLFRGLAAAAGGIVPNMSLLLSDGRDQALQVGVVCFRVQPVPHLPVLSSYALDAAQDNMVLLTLPVDSSPLDPNDVAFVSFADLPPAGTLYQFLAPPNASESSNKPDAFDPVLHPELVGAMIGDPLVREGAPISQWLSSITAYSSFYPDPDGGWGPDQLLGPPDAFPAYGDTPLAWAGLLANSPEWIEAAFDEPVFISTVEVFETFNTGHVTRLLAKHPSTGEWVLLWMNPDVAPAVPVQAGKARVLSPSLCPTSFPSREIRIETAPAGENWVELDAVRIVGLRASASLGVRDPLHRVWFQAPPFTRGVLPFSYTANSCRYFLDFRSVGVAVRHGNLSLVLTNHAPHAFNVSILTGSDGQADLGALRGSDPDGDDFAFLLLSTTTRGQLFIHRGVAPPLPSTTTTTTTGAGGDESRDAVFSPEEGIHSPKVLPFPQLKRPSLTGGPQSKQVVQPSSSSPSPLQQELELVDPSALPVRLGRGDRLVYRSTVPCDVSAEAAADLDSGGSRNGGGNGRGGGRREGGITDNAPGCYARDVFAFVSVDSKGMRSDAEAQGVVDLYCVRRVPLLSIVWEHFFRVLATTGWLSCALLGAFFIRHREEPIVKASSLVFNLLALTGCMGLYFSVHPLLSAKGLTSAVCFLRWALPCLSFTLLFGALWAKTFRVYRIISNTQLLGGGGPGGGGGRSRRAPLSNFDLIKVVLSMLSFMGMLLLLYGLLSPPQPVLFYKLDDAHTVYEGCTVHSVWQWLLLGSAALLLIGLALLTHRVRHVPSLWNEMSAIGISIYNSTLLGGLGIVLDFVLEGSNNIAAQVILRAFLLIVGMTVMVGALWGTKVVHLWAVWRAMQDERSTGVSALRKRLRRKLVQEALKAGRTPLQAEEDAAVEMERRDHHAMLKKKRIYGDIDGADSSSTATSRGARSLGGGGGLGGVGSGGFGSKASGLGGGTGGPAKGRLSGPGTRVSSAEHGSIGGGGTGHRTPSLHAGEKQAQLAQMQLQEKVQAHLRKQQQQQLAAASPTGALERARNSGSNGFAIPVLQLANGAGSSPTASSASSSASSSVPTLGSVPYQRPSSSASSARRMQLSPPVVALRSNSGGGGGGGGRHHHSGLPVPTLPEMSLTDLVSMTPAALLQWQASLAAIVAVATCGSSTRMAPSAAMATATATATATGAGVGAGVGGHGGRSSDNSASGFSSIATTAASSRRQRLEFNGGLSASGSGSGANNSSSDSAACMASALAPSGGGGSGTPPSKGASGDSTSSNNSSSDHGSSSGGAGATEAGRSSSSSPNSEEPVADGGFTSASPNLECENIAAAAAVATASSAPSSDVAGVAPLPLLDRSSLSLHVLPEVSVETSSSMQASESSCLYNSPSESTMASSSSLPQVSELMLLHPRPSPLPAAISSAAAASAPSRSFMVPLSLMSLSHGTSSSSGSSSGMGVVPAGALLPVPLPISTRRRVSSSSPALPDLVPEEDRSCNDEHEEQEPSMMPSPIHRIPSVLPPLVQQQQRLSPHLHRAALEAALSADSFVLTSSRPSAGRALSTQGTRRVSSPLSQQHLIPTASRAPLPPLVTVRASSSSSSCPVSPTAMVAAAGVASSSSPPLASPSLVCDDNDNAAIIASAAATTLVTSVATATAAAAAVSSSSSSSSSTSVSSFSSSSSPASSSIVVHLGEEE